MDSKPHRTNSNFQLQYFIANSCKTVDGAWSILYAQKIDIENKIQISELQQEKKQIKKLKLEKAIFESTDELDILSLQADLKELSIGEEIFLLNLEAAKNELAFIKKLMADLEPRRLYSHLPLLEANEAMQRTEWLEELKSRAENFLITQGTIPHDHLQTMRCHPDFYDDIVPFIKNVTTKLTQESGAFNLLTNSPALLLK